jgi:LPXTG-motif cell wall-anchored protein
MQISTQKRIARFLSVLLFALLVVALAVPAAQAMRAFSAATGASSTSAVRGTIGAQRQPTLAQLQRAHNGSKGPSVASGGGTVTATQPAPTGTSSTSVWIAVGAAVAVLIIALVAWALIRRRRQPNEAFAPSDYCAQHPEDPLCRAA